MRDRACRAAERGNSLGRRPPTLGFKKLAPHRSEGLAQFSHLAAPARLDRVRVVSCRKRADAGNEVVQRVSNRARKNAKKKRCEDHRRNSNDGNRGIELPDEMVHRLERHQHVALNRRARRTMDEDGARLVFIAVKS